MHDDRVWCVSAVDSAEDLARKLTETTWCGCTAFELEGYLWLNDATSLDGAQEFAVLKKCDDDDGRFVQIESITFSWCDYDAALRFIKATLDGEDDENDFRREARPVLESPEDHGRCHHCA